MILNRALPPSVFDGLVVANWKIKNRLRMYDEPEYRALQRFIRRGDVVVDIGGNMGQYASRMAELVGPSGKVVSFEAVPETYRLAKRILIRFPNVELHNVALSSTPGHVRMALYSDRHGRLRTGLSSVAETAWLGDPSEFVEVPSTTLDLAVEPLQPRPIHFIKCDVEGHEMEVLRGAVKVLCEDRPIVLCETTCSQLGQLEHLLDSLDYDVRRLDNSGLVPVADYSGPNFFLVPRESTR